MPKYPEKFLKWFESYGVLDEPLVINDAQLYGTYMCIAYRAYKRGLADATKEGERCIKTLN